MKVYLNKQYKCVKVEDNTFVANDSSNYIRYYFVTNANGDVIDKMDDTSVIYRNTEPSYVTVAFRRADGDVIQHLMASPKTDATGKSFFEYEITNTDGVLYKKGALEISAQFIEATLSEAGGVKKVISQKVKAIAINTAHVLDNIGEEAEEYYSQYEQANNDAHAVLQTQITTNFNNIGTLQDLTTDAKDDLVKAINEVDAHADANKSEIGNLATLTTDEKTTIVGAINEVDAHADANKAEIGNLSALTTDEKATLVGAINEVDNHADNAITLANNAVATANGAVATANEAKTTAQTAETNANSAVDTANAANATADEAKAIAQGSQRAIGFATLQAAITALNGYSNTQLKVGDNVYIVETGVPDLWVAAVEQNSVAYNYTTNDAFNDDLVENTLVQVGYYKFAYLESDGKPCTVAWQNMTVAASDWVASTEFENFAYEAKIALSDFVNFSSIPQVVFGLTEATSGNYAPICKAGDKGVYIYSKVNTAITLPTVVTFAPNVHGASMQGGGYTNKGKWVASTTYAIDDLVYTDNGQFVCIEGITSTTSPEQDTTHWQATFVATGKTKNGLKFSGQNTDGSAVQKTFDGSTAVEMAFDETTMTAKEVNGVLKIGAKGTVPEALPQTAGALKSGNLPTSGWGVSSSLWTGSKVMPYNPGYVGNIGKTWASSSDELEELPNGWQATMNGTLYANRTARLDSDSSTRGIQFGITGTGVGADEALVRIYTNGDIYVWNNKSSETRTITQIGCSLLSKQIYTISDTDITANSDVLMELTDEGGVKSYSMEAGSITVIRDTVPTQVITYTYKVKQTNASGQFTLINHYGENTMAASLQKASVLKSGNLPTSGWSTSAAKELFYDNLNFAGYSSSAIDNGKILPPYNYTSKKSTSDWTGTQIRGKNISYCQQKTDGDGIKYISLYFESGYGINSHKEAEIRIYDDGTVKAWHYSDNSYWETVKIVSTFLSDYIYTISDTDITANSDVLMELTDDGETKSYSIKSGKITVIRSKVPTYPIPYTYKVKQTNASGQFTLVNHYVPSIPESPMSLPVTYKKASGSLPTSGWTATVLPLWEGTVNVQGTQTGVAILPPNSLNFNKLKQYTTKSDWQIWTSASSTYETPIFVSAGSSTIMIGGNDKQFQIKSDGSLYGYNGSSSDVVYKGLKCLANSQYTFPISDTFITANTSVKMYLTDAGGVKAQSKANGSITVIRDEVPTTAIPYEYEVEQTSAEGLFEVINAYVPAVPTKTSQLTNDSNFAKTTEANTWTGVQTFSNADGIKTDRVHNLDNNDAWYNFDGANNRFGSPSRPTIIRTSEARPRAQVPSGETTVTKEIALLEDIPGNETDWASGAAGSLVTYGKGAGVYQIKLNVEGSPCCFAYWDGTSDSGYCSSYVSMQLDADGFWLFNYEFYIEAKQIKCKHYAYKMNGGTVTKEIDQLITSFTYRKILN